jgi:hypothetical protein
MAYKTRNPPTHTRHYRCVRKDDSKCLVDCVTIGYTCTEGRYAPAMLCPGCSKPLDRVAPPVATQPK